jgi:hypothetical protein
MQRALVKALGVLGATGDVHRIVDPVPPAAHDGLDRYDRPRQVGQGAGLWYTTGVRAACSVWDDCPLTHGERWFPILLVLNAGCGIRAAASSQQTSRLSGCSSRLCGASERCGAWDPSTMLARPGTVRVSS